MRLLQQLNGYRTDDRWCEVGSGGWWFVAVGVLVAAGGAWAPW
jgi:hypothetical protein